MKLNIAYLVLAAYRVGVLAYHQVASDEKHLFDDLRFDILNDNIL